MEEERRWGYSGGIEEEMGVVMMEATVVVMEAMVAVMAKERGGYCCCCQLEKGGTISPRTMISFGDVADAKGHEIFQ